MEPPVAVLHLPGTGLPPSRELLLRLTSELTLAGIEHAAGTSLMVHAAGLAFPDGRVIALVGESGAGKTTATRALCRTDGPAGFGYVTDETVAVDADLRVRPFPKPLALVENGPTPKVHRGPDDLGLATAPARLTLAGVVLLRRDAEHRGPPRVTPVAQLDLMAALVPHTSALTRLPDPVRRLADLVGRCAGYAVRYREADDLAGGLGELSWDPPQGLTQDDLGARDEPTDSGPVATRQPGAADVLVTADGAFLLIDSRPVRLSAVGVSVWQGLQAGLRGPRLVEHVIDRHGPHPDADALVEDTRATLCALALPVLADAADGQEDATA